jgi:hypothetical protein
MKKACVIILSLLSICSYSQQVSVSWSDDFKMRGKVDDINLIGSDSEGNTYLYRSSRTNMLGVEGKRVEELVKYNKDLKEIFDYTYKKELEKTYVEKFVIIKDKLYLIAFQNGKGTSNSKVFSVVEINKATGEFVGQAVPIGNFSRDDKWPLPVTVRFSQDSTKLILIGDVSSYNSNKYVVQFYISDWPVTTAAKAIKHPDYFAVNDVVLTSDQRLVILGKIFDYIPGKKKKEYIQVFKGYDIRIFDLAGKQISQGKLEMEGKQIISAKLIEQNKNFVIAGMYDDGIFVSKLNNDGTLSNAKFQSLKQSEIEKDNEGKDYKSEGKTDDYVVRHILPQADGSVIVLAELFNQYNFAKVESGDNPYYRDIYTSGDLFAFKADKDLNIAWSTVLPKRQVEDYVNGIGYGYFFSYPTHQTIFGSGVMMPMYGSVYPVQYNDKILLFFNDNPANASVTNANSKAKRMMKPDKSAGYMVALDPQTGNMKRQEIYQNDGLPIAMPRFAVPAPGGIYVAGMRSRWIGQTGIKLGIIQIK